MDYISYSAACFGVVVSCHNSSEGDEGKAAMDDMKTNFVDMATLTPAGEKPNGTKPIGDADDA